MKICSKKYLLWFLIFLLTNCGSHVTWYDQVPQEFQGDYVKITNDVDQIDIYNLSNDELRISYPESGNREFPIRKVNLNDDGDRLIVFYGNKIDNGIAQYIIKFEFHPDGFYLTSIGFTGGQKQEFFEGKFKKE